MGAVLLEVSVAHERDAAGAREGGADRLYVVGRPGAAVVSGICHATDLPVFVELPAGPDALGYAEDVLGWGADGVGFGPVDDDLEVDLGACRDLAGALPGVPWTFTRAIDDTLDPRRSWRRLADRPPGLVAVCSAGSPRGMGDGYDDLLAAAESDPAISALLMPGGGLLAEHVPWLVRAGVRSFRVDAQVRPGGSDRAYVDAALVRSWRLLLDDALHRV